jgi:outer membrane protein OmpA-like peptidoglycan-associated protein
MKVLLIIVVSLFFGCTSEKVSTISLKQAHLKYKEIKKDLTINDNAPVQLYKAGKIYDLSKNAKSVEEADTYAYILNKKIDIAIESAKSKELEEKLELLKQKKITAQLDAKQSEILRAKHEAQMAYEQKQMVVEENAELKEKFSQLQELNAQMTKRGLVLTISDVLFESGKATLLSGASRAIDKLSEFLIENPKRAILIEGHTDNIGSSTYNIDLSLRRAEAVASALEKRGIESFRVTKRGYGEEFPVTTNSTPEGRQQNRRVEVIIINEGIDPNSVLR